MLLIFNFNVNGQLWLQLGRKAVRRCLLTGPRGPRRTRPEPRPASDSNEQVLERDKQAQNRKTKPNPHVDPHTPYLDYGLQAPAFPTEVGGQRFGGEALILL